MSRSFSGLIEAYLVSIGYLAHFVSGVSLGAAKALPFGIAGPKELIFDDYEAPKDAFNNILKGKKKIDLQGETFECTLSNFEWIHLFAQTGCELVVVSEGCSEYEGNASGVPLVGGGVYWRKNISGGIIFFTYADRTHMGLDYEYKLSNNLLSIDLMLSAAFPENKYKSLIQNAGLNIIHKTAVTLPNMNADNQYLTECKQLRIMHNGVYVDVFNWDEIEDRTLSYKTVPNKKAKDGRSVPNLIDVSLEITGVYADVTQLDWMLTLDKFAKINLTEEMPDGTLIQHYINANTLSNNTNFRINKDKRTATFSVNGQISIKRFTVDADNNTVTVG